MPKPSLLLCFDAFGTLFKPKRPIAQQYAEVARQCGIGGFNDEELRVSLQAAIKEEATQNPNYGRATGLGATRWWTNVINKTFKPLLNTNEALPAHMVPHLLRRFSSSEGYEAEPNLVSTLKRLKYPHDAQKRFNSILVGVITNSDDRVPDILSSLGINVSPLRYGVKVEDQSSLAKDYDIDFHCISYDAGVEKPDPLIFKAAEHLLADYIASQGSTGPTELKAKIRTWKKVYVGDEYAKDVMGAVNANWNAVLLDGGNGYASIPNIEDNRTQTLDGLFREGAVVRVDSIQALVSWLTAGEG